MKPSDVDSLESHTNRTHKRSAPPLWGAAHLFLACLTLWRFSISRTNVTLTRWRHTAGLEPRSVNLLLLSAWKLQVDKAVSTWFKSNFCCNIKNPAVTYIVSEHRESSEWRRFSVSAEITFFFALTHRKKEKKKTGRLAETAAFVFCRMWEDKVVTQTFFFNLLLSDVHASPKSRSGHRYDLALATVQYGPILWTMNYRCCEIYWLDCYVQFGWKELRAPMKQPTLKTECLDPNHLAHCLQTNSCRLCGQAAKTPVFGLKTLWK